MRVCSDFYVCECMHCVLQPYGYKEYSYLTLTLLCSGGCIYLLLCFLCMFLTVAERCIRVSMYCACVIFIFSYFPVHGFFLVSSLLPYVPMFLFCFQYHSFIYCDTTRSRPVYVANNSLCPL